MHIAYNGLLVEESSHQKVSIEGFGLFKIRDSDKNFAWGYGKSFGPLAGKFFSKKMCLICSKCLTTQIALQALQLKQDKRHIVR